MCSKQNKRFKSIQHAYRNKWTLTKHISCEGKFRFDGRRCYSDEWCNNHQCQFECKKNNVCKKYRVPNPATCSCGNERAFSKC